ncbi:sugar ABC transporter substrate-binding protein [Burkholderia pseudomallei]|uniref:sugar ABC transporter substrate-binding protein n=1 Tax=Burkholderia pseudomallei TaxID=28450 RepID=UPI001AD7351B|nr:sugar ABC transporter substrate-binding protein [Burkholderia pseudomallei]MBO7828010.1 sugar ABC transporter substrate-binding protein [Burkholderia pseudomallei]
MQPFAKPPSKRAAPPPRRIMRRGGLSYGFSCMPARNFALAERFREDFVSFDAARAAAFSDWPAISRFRFNGASSGLFSIALKFICDCPIPIETTRRRSRVPADIGVGIDAREAAGPASARAGRVRFPPRIFACAARAFAAIP